MLPRTSTETRSLDPEFVRRIAFWAVCLFVAALVVVGTLQWFQPVPSSSFQSRVGTSLRFRGVLPVLPWPRTGEAALSVYGAGSLGHGVDTAPAPISSLAMVMTALVVFRNHPLGEGSTGPMIKVTQSDVMAATAENTAGETTIPVIAGEKLTERQALEALLVAQANDIAILLASWDAGNVSRFVRRMNGEARSLRLTSTTFADPAGLSPSTTSTPGDLVRLGAAVMAVPTLATIVAMPQVELPLAGLVYNFDFDVTHDGFVGIKTGSSDAAGGCFLFADERTFPGQRLTVIGAVLGQEGVSTLTTALAVAEGLVNAAFASLRTVAMPFGGAIVGDLVTPWGSSTPVRAVGKKEDVLAWPGLVIPVTWHVRASRAPLEAGAKIGDLRIGLSKPGIGLALRTQTDLTGPSSFWKATRL